MMTGAALSGLSGFSIAQLLFPPFKIQSLCPLQGRMDRYRERMTVVYKRSDGGQWCGLAASLRQGHKKTCPGTGRFVCMKTAKSYINVSPLCTFPLSHEKCRGF